MAYGMNNEQIYAKIDQLVADVVATKHGLSTDADLVREIIVTALKLIKD